MDGSAAGRLRQARERAGLSEREVADRLGPPLAWYCDLEMHPGELFDTVSLAQLRALGGLLNMDPCVLLTGEPAAGPRISFGELAERLEARRTAERLSVAELSERVGWELKDVLTDPGALWNFNVTGLRGVCAAVGMDWRAALPGA